MKAASYSAKRVPVHRGKAAWKEILPYRAPNAPLDTDLTADFVVVGGGFAGLAACRRLLELEPQSKVVLLEAGEIGAAASGRNSGFMIDLPHELTSENYAGEETSKDRDLIELNRRAIQFAAAAVEDYGIDPNFFDPAGKINGAATEKSKNANLSYAEHLRSLNESYECLDQQQMKEITGSDYYISGLYTPGTVMLQPAGLVCGLADGLSRHLKLYENSPVIQMAQDGSVWCVKTARGSVKTERIIMACNGHLESFGFKRGRLMHVFLFAAMTRELTVDEIRLLGGRSRWGITPSDPMGTTVRRIDAGHGGNRIALRNCAEFRPNMQASQHKMDHAKEVLQRKFDDRFPNLAGIQMEFSWAGQLCLSQNSVSVTGEIEKGIFAACCQNGLGTARGTVTGIAAAELACGKSSFITEFFATDAEPKRLPPRPLSTWGANTYLRWKEFQARQE